MAAAAARERRDHHRHVQGRALRGPGRGVDERRLAVAAEPQHLVPDGGPGRAWASRGRPRRRPAGRAPRAPRRRGPRARGAAAGAPAAGRRASRARRTPAGSRGGAPSGRPSGRAPGRPALLAHPAEIARHLPARGARDGARRHALDVADRLAQAAVLVEVAPHELDRRVVVSVQNGGTRVVDLEPARVEHRPRERLVLGVRHVGEADLRPAGAGVAGVHVREEDGAVDPLDPGLAVRREALEELGELAGDHRARVRARQVRPVGGAHARDERERLAVGVEPALDRLGVLGQEADQVAGGALGAEVAGAAVPELRGRDLDHLGARGAGDLDGAVARARVDHEQLVGPLARERREQRRQELLAVEHGDDDRDRGHAATPARARRGPGGPRRARGGRRPPATIRRSARAAIPG